MTSTHYAIKEEDIDAFLSCDGHHVIANDMGSF